MAKTPKEPKEKKIKAADRPFLTPPDLNIDPHQFEGIKTMYALIENFKGIESRVVAVGGKSILVVGRNEAGKSSIIQVLKGTLDSSYLPSEGLKQGEESGRITHKIAGNIENEYYEYTIDYFFDPKNLSGRIRVLDANMQEVKSPTKILKAVMGNVSFSLTKWLNDPVAKKIETLKKISGRGQEIDLVNIDIASKKASIKSKKERAEVLEAQLNNHGIPKEVIEAHQNPVDIAPIQAEMENITKVQSMFDNVSMQCDNFHRDIQRIQTDIANSELEKQRIYDEIQRLQNQLARIDEDNAVRRNSLPTLQSNILEAQKWMAANPRPDTSAVSARMTAAINHNNMHNQVIALAEKHKELFNIKGELANDEKSVATLETKRDEIVNNSQLPVKGLSWTNDQIFLDGLPFDDLQINTQRKWFVSVQIAKALSPNYKGIFIDDGSLFDKAHLQAIVDEIERDGYFAVIELVDQDGGDLEIKFAEQVLHIEPSK